MKIARFTSLTTCLSALLTIASFNNGWAKSVESTVKDWLDDSADALKKGVSELGDDFRAIQDYLDNYHWKGIIQDRATCGPATLKYLELNNHSKVVVVKPGEKVEAEVNCDLDPDKCANFSVYRIVVGLKGEGPQAIIGSEVGLIGGKSREKFILTAPDKPGIYQIRFRPVDSLFKAADFDAWKDKDGNEPSGTTTIGIIVVK